MLWIDTLSILKRLALLSLATGGATLVPKYLIRVSLTLRGAFPENGTKGRKLWREGVRVIAVVIGGCLGALDVWPPLDDWQPLWGPLLGIVAGTSSAAIYDAWFELIDGTPQALLGGLRAWLSRFAPGGGAAAPTPETEPRHGNPLDTMPTGDRPGVGAITDPDMVATSEAAPVADPRADRLE